MKRIFLFLFLCVSFAGSAQKYALDKNFNTDGYWFSKLPGDDRGYDVGVQADGKIVTAGGIGQLSDPSDARCIVTRLNADGSPDAAFGNNGTVEFKFDNQSSIAYALDIQTDGKIVIVARVATERIGVARLLPDGKFDTGFHKTGTHVLPVPTLYFESDETPMDITHQEDGKIVVAFSSYPIGTAFSVATVVRLLDDGEMDNSFSLDGIAYGDVLSITQDVVSGVKCYKDLIYVCGYANIYGTINFTLYRFKSDGSLDTGFDTDGIVAGPEGKCSDMGVQSTGRPILAGYTTKGNREFLVTAYRPDGRRDSTFAGIGFGYSPVKINGMALLPNDDIVLAGYHSVIAPFSFFTTILNKEGAPTVSFLNGAFFQSNINGKDEELHNVAVGPGGEIVVAGYYENNITGEDQVVLYMKNEILPQQVRLITGKGEGVQGDTILVPVRLEGCTDLYFMQGEVALANPSVGTIVGMVKNTIDVTFNGSAFNFFNGNGVKLTRDTLFFVKIVLSGAPGDSTSVKVTAPAGSVIEVGCSTVNLTPHTVVAGSVRILANLKLSGTLLDRLGKPVGKAFVSLTGKTKDSKPLSYQMTTGADGTYLFDKVPPGSSVTIKPSKDINPKNGVTAHDMFVGQRWLLNLKPPEFTSALQVVAGDANNNKLFSSQDLAIMQSVSLGTLMGFPNQTSWVFVPASHTFPTAFTVSNVFPYPDQATLTNVQKDAVIHFTGIKVGDIVTTADAQNKSGSGAGQETSPLEFRLHQERTGDEIAVRIEAQRFQDIGSVQWGLHFDAAQLQWVRADAPGWSVNVASATGGELAFSWFSRDGLAKTMNNGNAVITLYFQAAHAHALHMNAPLVELSEAIVETEAIALPAGSQTTQSVPLLLRGPAATTPVSNLALADGYHLGQSAPNPARNAANIPFKLGQDGEVLLEVSDNTGRIIRRITQTLPAGAHQIEVHVEDLLPGSYFYRLQSGRFSSVRSMIVAP